MSGLEHEADRHSGVPDNFGALQHMVVVEYVAMTDNTERIERVSLLTDYLGRYFGTPTYLASPVSVNPNYRAGSAESFFVLDPRRGTLSFPFGAHTRILDSLDAYAALLSDREER